MKKAFAILSLVIFAACSSSQSSDQSKMDHSSDMKNMQNMPQQPQQNMQKGTQPSSNCDGSCCPHRCTRPKPPCCGK